MKNSILFIVTVLTISVYSLKSTAQDSDYKFNEFLIDYDCHYCNKAFGYYLYPIVYVEGKLYNRTLAGNIYNPYFVPHLKNRSGFARRLNIYSHKIYKRFPANELKALQLGVEIIKDKDHEYIEQIILTNLSSPDKQIIIKPDEINGNIQSPYFVFEFIREFKQNQRLASGAGFELLRD